MTTSLRRAAGRLVACLVFFALSGDAHAQNSAVAPAWTLKAPDGKTIRLSDYRGKVVLLDFWATWCPPCRKEIPTLVALQNKYGPEDFVVVGISRDEEAQAVAPFARKTGMNYPIALGTPQVVAAYGNVSIIPTAFLIGRDGRIVAVHEGLVDEATLDAEIKPLL